MGLYNFKPRFVPYILDGSKTHTIRAERKTPEKPGDTMHLYTGLRQKGAKLLGRFPCIKVDAIEIDALPAVFLEDSGPVIRINGEALADDECNALAWRDGFRNSGHNGAFAEMMQFWAGRLPFRGHIIHWKWSER